MILIADGGSTKTDWRLVDGKTITQLRTAGLNPYHLSKEDIAAVIQDEFKEKVNAKDVEKNILKRQ